MSDYEKLTDRELDTMIAQRLLGWTLMEKAGYPKGVWLNLRGIELPNGEHWPNQYATSDNAVRLVRDRIAERGLTLKFMDMLVSMCPHTSGYSHQIFEAMQAIPRQQCIAALMALEAK
jgi:hypothetical protein